MVDDRRGVSRDDAFKNKPEDGLLDPPLLRPSFLAVKDIAENEFSVPLVAASGSLLVSEEGGAVFVIVV